MTKRVRPWLARADWREGVIHWRGDGRPARNIASAIVLTAIGFVAFNDTAGCSRLAVVFIFGIRRIVQERAFGGSTLTFEHIPFLLGGKLKGVIRTHVSGIGEETKIMLSCFQGSYDEESGPHWRAIHVLLPNQMHRDRDQASIDVDFAIPADEPATSLGLNRFVWEVSIVKGFPSGRRVVMFDVPVFPREAEEFVQETGVTRGAKSDVRKELSVFDE